jgi:hypothetical protein
VHTECVHTRLHLSYRMAYRHEKAQIPTEVRAKFKELGRPTIQTKYNYVAGVKRLDDQDKKDEPLGGGPPRQYRAALGLNSHPSFTRCCNSGQLISVEIGFCISDVEVPTLNIAKLSHALNRVDRGCQEPLWASGRHGYLGRLGSMTSSINPIRVAPGTSSRAQAALTVDPSRKAIIPVTLPAGRVSLVVKPSAIGSASTATTMGIVPVAFAAATASIVAAVKMTSGALVAVAEGLQSGCYSTLIRGRPDGTTDCQGKRWWVSGN